MQTVYQQPQPPRRAVSVHDEKKKKVVKQTNITINLSWGLTGYKDNFLLACWEGFAAFSLVWIAATLRGLGTGVVVNEFASLIIGFSTFVIMTMFRGASGNPINLLAAVLYRRIGIIAFLLAIIAQLAGALVACVAVQWGFNVSVGNAIPHTMAPFPQYSALIAELFAATLVTIMYLISTGHGHHYNKPLAVGVAISVVSLTVWPISNACINPWFHLSTAIIGAVWTTDCWVYYVGDFVAGILAPLGVWLFGMLLHTPSEDIFDDFVSREEHHSQ
jgi:glycerol uptake facilitator-like aquaporin